MTLYSSKVYYSNTCLNYHGLSLVERSSQPRSLERDIVASIWRYATDAFLRLPPLTHACA